MADSQFSTTTAFLLSQVGAFVAQRFADRLGGHGLTPRDFGVLSNIDQFGPRTQQQLADELGMHRNNMVALIDSMERSGWVVRGRGADRRANVIELSEAGRTVIDLGMTVVRDLNLEVRSWLADDDVADQLNATLAAAADSAGLAPGVHTYLSPVKRRSRNASDAAPITDGSPAARART